ncbi:unnamed protein product, partial [Adineta steineri]
SQNTDITTLSDTSNSTASINVVRPSSANQKTDVTTENDSTAVRPRSRPPSATQKHEENTLNDSNVEQQNTSVLFNTNDSNITQPIIGRPSSALNKMTTEENKPVEITSSTSRTGSAAKTSQT